MTQRTENNTPPEERIRRCAKNLQAALDRYSYSVEDLAEQACLPADTVRRMADGKPVGQRALRRVAGALQLWNPWDLTVEQDAFLRRLAEAEQYNDGPPPGARRPTETAEEVDGGLMKRVISIFLM